MRRRNNLRSYSPVILIALLASFSGILGAPLGRPAATSTGPRIYRDRCAACHGDNGEGTKRYPHALTGSRPVAELARYIARSMPPGPRKCAGDDARKVAAYLYDAFYSPIAQARNR